MKSWNKTLLLTVHSPSDAWGKKSSWYTSQVTDVLYYWHRWMVVVIIRSHNRGSFPYPMRRLIIRYQKPPRRAICISNRPIALKYDSCHDACETSKWYNDSMIFLFYDSCHDSHHVVVYSVSHNSGWNVVVALYIYIYIVRAHLTTPLCMYCGNF